VTKNVFVNFVKYSPNVFLNFRNKYLSNIASFYVFNASQLYQKLDRCLSRQMDV